MSLRAALSAIVIVVAGCRSTPKAGTVPSDGGTDAAPGSIGAADSAALDAGVAKERDRKLVAIAEGAYDVGLDTTFDGRIVLHSGSLLYEARPTGAIEPLLPASGFAAMFPDDETFVGYLEPSVDVYAVHGELGSPGPLLVNGAGGGKPRTLTLRDGKLTARTPAVEARHIVRWRGKLLGGNVGEKLSRLAWIDEPSAPAPKAPPGIGIITAMAVDGRGALVVFGHGSYEKPRAAIYSADQDLADAPVVVEGAKASSCVLVPAFDGGVYMRCDDSSSNSTYFRVSAKGFERAFADAPTESSTGSVGKDGALYVGSSKGFTVQRCAAAGGKCTPIALETDFASNRAARYQSSVSDVLERHGDDIGSRSWTTIRIEAITDKTLPRGIQTIVARGEDDVWVLARDYRRGIVFHSREDVKRELLRLPSQLDGRFMVRNANAPQPWTAHCEQVFVRLGGTNADEIGKRAPEIEKALGAPAESYESAFHWWLVEGRLHESPVVGVVVVRRDVEESLDKMERAIERLITAFSPNPVSKPPAYCTLPVLERRLHPGLP